MNEPISQFKSTRPVVRFKDAEAEHYQELLNQLRKGEGSFFVFENSGSFLEENQPHAALHQQGLLKSDDSSELKSQLTSQTPLSIDQIEDLPDEAFTTLPEDLEMADVQPEANASQGDES